MFCICVQTSWSNKNTMTTYSKGHKWVKTNSLQHCSRKLWKSVILKPSHDKVGINEKMTWVWLISRIWVPLTDIYLRLSNRLSRYRALIWKNLPNYEPLQNSLLVWLFFWKTPFLINWHNKPRYTEIHKTQHQYGVQIKVFGLKTSSSRRFKARRVTYFSIKALNELLSSL